MKRPKAAKEIGIVLIVLSMLVLFASNIFAPTSPHNVIGQVFTDNSKIDGAPAGLPVLINDTVTLNFTLSFTTDPGPPPLKGTYSDTVEGNDNDLIVVTAWNATHYGMSNATLASTTTTIDVVLNRTRQSETNVTIIIPPNNSIKRTSNVFNVTANITILGSDATNCNATISFSNNVANITQDQNFTNLLGDIGFHQSRTTIWNLTGIREGIVGITVKAQCFSDGAILEGYNRYTILVSLNDTIIPVVSLMAPLNNSWVKANITFEYNVTETTGIKNCSLYIDNRLNQTSYTLQPDVKLNFTLNNTAEGQHSWNITCYDNSTNQWLGTSISRVFNADSTSPNITLLFPLNNSGMSSYSILFKYNVSDNFNATNCTLIINNEARQTNYTISLNISNNFSTSLAGGNYNWSVNCSDNSNNIGNSGFFSILSADLMINSSYLIFSKNNPAEHELISINATVFNLGAANTTNNVTIQFFEIRTDGGSTQIGTDFHANITAGGNITLIANYSTTVGLVSISIVIDPLLLTNGSIIESNESNNNASKAIFIPAYQIYYGNVLSDIILDTSYNLTVFAWLNISTFTGNVFVADSDSLVDFPSLHAIGSNLSGNLTLNDFEEIDARLNTTNLTDSINRSYTSNGAISNLVNFTIFKTLITDVPIVNSTNTSNFVTGILWDTSDANSGQYNGTQDIAFVTKLNRNSLGLYGTYDYEIRVPGNLKRYITPNLDSTVSFYREIT